MKNQNPYQTKSEQKNTEKQYKYNIRYLLTQLTVNKYKLAKSKIHLICKISESTFDRYTYLKKGAKAEIPASVLLTLAKFFEVEPEALLNYEIEKFTHEQLKEIAFNNPLNDDTQPATN